MTPPGAGDAGVSDAGIDSGGDAGAVDGSVPDAALPPFEAAPPAVYVAKVKNILTGLPVTDAEVQAVVNDPNALRGLIDGWMALSQFQGRSLDFFRNAFQQNQVVMDTFANNIGLDAKFRMNNAYQARLARSLMDSFPLTVWQLVQGGKPLNSAVTTNSYMLTTAQMAILSYIDESHIDDADVTDNRLDDRKVLAQVVFDPASTATLAQSINPSDPSYMIWPNLMKAGGGCTPSKLTFSNASKYVQLFHYLFGFGNCGGPTTFAPTFSDSDFTDYHLVKIIPTSVGTPNTTPAFWDIPTMRTATSMTLHTPRIGFFGTMAFAANWGTNAGNEARVTANQSLIVSIGQSINGSGTLVTFPVNSTDASHASDPACMGCHSQLDPFKQFFRQSYTVFYHDQTDASQLLIPANFGIDGVTASGTGVGDLANILATHPRFALAWTEKLYYWATSHGLDETDPEVLRIASVFQTSGYDFKALVREVLSSPLTTYASTTLSTQATGGDPLSIARRDQLCASLSNRLGLTDVCGMVTPNPNKAQKGVLAISQLIATDTYYRAFELPSLPTLPDLFFRSSAEALCTLVAAEVVDAGASSRYKSSSPTTAIADLVATVMNLPPSDPRSAPALQILTDHFTAAAAVSGASATNALDSTFILACTAPVSVLIGL